jgi:hypothetical protein
MKTIYEKPYMGGRILYELVPSFLVLEIDRREGNRIEIAVRMGCGGLYMVSHIRFCPTPALVPSLPNIEGGRPMIGGASCRN